MKIESSELISSESIFHSLDVSITNSVFCRTNTNIWGDDRDWREFKINLSTDEIITKFYNFFI